MKRRDFLRHSALVGGLGLVGRFPGRFLPGVSLVSDPADPVASAGPAQWAARSLERSLSSRGVTVQRVSTVEAAGAGDLCIVIAGTGHPSARALFAAEGVAAPASAESLALVPTSQGSRRVLLASAPDPRGLVYALLEAADRIDHAQAPLDGLGAGDPVVEQPANAVRVITRSFESDVEDKPWFNDRSFWPPYLSMLAAQRFNRFTLAFGLGYDFTRDITDCYFHFPYPFLLSVPGYDVRAVGLPDEERDHNLEMLRWIGEQTVARGLEFQLGLWTHAYQWTDSPDANYTISGLTHETHAPYCRDALHMLLEACPTVSSIAFRVHGESGVPEESYKFWTTVFDGVVRTGRTIEINMHAKGLDQRMIDVALGTGMPVTVAPKCWAEHRGLPYQQASIRELEKPPKHEVNGFFALSSGSRSFLRYGYGDLLSVDRKFGVYNRIWPGTERVLLWGDPASAAEYGRMSSFCGEVGVDLFEPLSFKGRRGSGLPGGRCAYEDAALKPRYDFEKFLYTYRVWGRHLYNPDTDPEVWRRFLRIRFGAAATSVEGALTRASRILPLVTTAHGPSAANNTYWPEIYTNMRIVDVGARTIYGDSARPRVFGNASSFDPELFASVNDCAKEMLAHAPSGRVTPPEVARWLEEMAEAAAEYLAEARSKVSGGSAPEFRRMATDVAIQIGLGRFFAWKFRAGVLYAVFEQTGDLQAVKEALTAYHRARDAWAGLAEGARGVYAADITYGPERHLRGHWVDRLAFIDEDIGEMEKKAAAASTAAPSAAAPGAQSIRTVIREILTPPDRAAGPWRHVPPAGFRPGSALGLAIEVGSGSSGGLSVRLRYRHVNQAEDWQVLDMDARDSRHGAEVPGDYTRSPYPLQYFFEVHEAGRAWHLPRIDPNRPGQPYFVVQPSRA